MWFADGQDGGTVQDAACGNNQPSGNNNTQPNNHRLSGAASYNPWSYLIDNTDTYNPLVNTKISGDPARMGDQEKIGLATMSSFFRRYVGGEGAFEPYMTGELSTTENHLQIPASACPTSESGTRIGCEEYVSTSYFAPTAERVDVIRPEVENPLTLNALGGSLAGSGFAYPYLDNGGVVLPTPTTQGFDWCNPEPDDFAPSQLGKTTQPTAAKPCPLPGKAELGGQNGTRENSPVNMSYGRQLALAWEAGTPATLTADIPAASQDLSGLKALTLGADVNYFDARNPGSQRVVDGVVQPVAYNPAAVTQDFHIVLRDTDGNEAVVNAGDPKWGNALHLSPGTVTARMHIVLDQIRVPLSVFADQGVDLTSLAAVEFRFGGEGTPASGSIQIADVRFQEKAVAEPLILSDGVAPNQGAGYGPPATGPDPAALLAGYDVTAGNLKLIDTVGTVSGNTTWTVDDDRAQCPNANFSKIQDAVDHASPWDTIVICEGVYDERSTPVRGGGNPVATDALNGLTITKPLKIKGVGADKVTIRPDQSLTTLAGVTPYLRDGGGNVITVSRQSLGSTDTNEMFVDISGVTVTSGSVFAEAGIAFFGAAGRVSESVVGPFRTATTATELAEYPHGWGIVKTSLILGAGPGTVENEVTVTNSVVKGYQSGGILFDGGRGIDGHADNVVRTGTKQHGYVTNTVVTGTPNSVYPQAGIKYASGTDGFVRNSRITNNWFRPDPSKSFGLLLTDARTETAGALVAQGSILTGNGFAAANLTADGTAPRTAAAFVVQGTFLGAGNPVVGGPANPSDGIEAVSGLGTNGAASVTVQQRATNPVASVPTTVGAIVDAAPTAALVDPAAGQEVLAGTGLAPLVRASDDFAVRSVTLLADGQPVATSTTSPYRFDWTSTPEQAGSQITLTATVTDATGRTTTSAPVTVSVVAEIQPTTLAVDLDPTATASGRTVRATATVTTTGEPTGSVVLTSGTTVLGTAPVAGGQAVIDFPTTGLPIGRSDLTAAFVPEGAFGPSEITTSLAVNFTDMPGGSLFYDEVLWLAESGISRGNPDGSFAPATSLSRGAMAAFIYRLANDGATAPVCTVQPFSDVAIDSQFCGEITWMKDTALTTGFTDGTFRPTVNISRQAMAAFLYRLGTDNAPAPVCDPTLFADITGNSFCGEITWMGVNKISTGTDGAFKPTDPTSRQAMAAFLFRFAALS